MQSSRKMAQLLGALLFALACVFSAHAQITTGNVRGTVTDPNGAIVPNAKVTITKKSTNVSSTTQSSGSGQFEFSNLPVGDDYIVSVEAANFKTLTLTDVKVQLNQVTDLATQLSLGAVGETVTVTAGGTELVDTTTSNLSKSFSSRQVSELGQTGAGTIGSAAGVNNLALLAPGVTSSGGVGLGTGGSVGGQRPRNNNFMIDGVDNNDKAVTGPQSYVSPEEVAEFSLVQNQFSAEFGRNGGGQFITVTKTGTNDFHGAFHVGFRNRYLNALDELQKLAGVTRNKADGDLFLPRYDAFRGGYNVGGPVFFPRWGEGGPSLWKLRDKLFFFTSYERLQTGSAVGAPGIVLPTLAGFTTLTALPGVRTINLNVLKQFLNLNPASNTKLDACNVISVHNDCPTANIISVDAGTVNIPSPNFFKQNHAVINLDYNQSQDTQHHWRFLMTNGSDIDTTSSLPIFFAPLPSKQRLFSYTLIHNFSQNLINETRLAFRRSQYNNPVPNFSFPGLASFPNFEFDDLQMSFGPGSNAPQFGIENNYQVVNNMTWIAGRHTFKFGGDFRKVISPQHFVQRERGDYEYLFIDDYLRDFSPEFGERNVGSNTYYGDQKILYAFVQDDWRMRPNFTVNLGVGYSYQEVTKGSKAQTTNALASAPGLLEFNEPKAQTKNFTPKIGFAWSPDYNSGMLGRLFGSSGKSSIRAGFSMAYDYIFDNLGVLSNMPQAQQTIDVAGGTGQADTCCPGTNFLASGGINNILTLPTTAVGLRGVTSSWIPDQKVPYSLTWTGSIQRQFKQDWSLELRYLGTRGIHLITQNRINVQAKVSPEDGRSGLPTYITSAPTQAQIDALPASTLSLADINARSRFVPRFAAAGFNGANVVAFISNGNSTYHGASASLTKRFSNGFQMTSAYTWSHLIDDTTAEVFATVLSPRRVEDFQNLRRERASSALDHRHRFVTSAIYELPWFKNSKGFAKTLLGGFGISGTYTAESGERMTIRSGNDANLNGDSAGDRGILNPGGTEGVGSTVSALVRTCPGFVIPGDPTSGCTTTTPSRTVGYVAKNPAAKYIQTGNGAVSNLGRNTFLLPGINNFDISIFKKFSIGESKYFQLRADFFNAFNHPQYVPGSVNTVELTSNTNLTTLNQIAPLTSDFLNPKQVLSSNPRVIVLGGRFVF